MARSAPTGPGLRPRLRLFALAALLASGAVNAAWPDKPIRWVVPYPPGAMGDIVGRLAAEGVRTRLGQPVVVDNRPGAGGNIGAGQVAQGAPDGSVFLVAATNNLVINQYLYRDMSFDPLKAFAPVTVMVDVPAVLYTNASVPAASFAAFAAHAGTQKGKLNYGSPGSGTTIHLFTEGLNRAHRLGMTHVSYKGAAPAMAALLANDIQLFAIGAGVGAPHVKAGKLRALAVASPARLPLMPDTPTFAEAGLGNALSANWWGLVAPAGTPREIVDRMHATLATVFAEPSVKTRMDELGNRAVLNGPEAMRAQLTEEAKYWARTVKELGATVD